MANMFEPSAPGETAPSPDWIAQSARARQFMPDRRFGKPDRRHAEPAAPSSQDDALANARSEGEALGRAQAEAEFAEILAARDSLRSQLAIIDEAAGEMLAARLAETVALLCERTLEPLALDREQLNRRCRKAVQMLGQEMRQLTLHVNPEDVSALDQSVAEGLRIEPDPLLERGSIKLEGVEGCVLDGPLQWRAAIADALGCDPG